MNSLFTKPIINKLIILLFLLLVIPLLILSFYTKPALDDFPYAIHLSKKSFLENQIHEYLNWGSRYTATAILITNPIRWNYFFGYNLIAAFMILSFVLAAAYVFFQLTKNFKTTLLYTSFFSFTYFMFLPNIYQGIYWLPGSATYHLANILFLVFIGLIIKHQTQSNTALKFTLFILIFLIICCNELSIIFLDIFLFLIFIFSYVSKKKVSTLYLGLFLILLFFGSFPILWSLGVYIPSRSINIIFLVVLLFNMIFSHKIVTSPLVYKTNISPFFSSIIFLNLIFSYTFILRDKDMMSIPNNLYLAYHDLLSRKAFRYKKEVNSRYRLIKESNEGTIYFTSIHSKPNMIFNTDLSQDPNYFYNKSMAEFFHKKAIICK